MFIIGDPQKKDVLFPVLAIGKNCKYIKGMYQTQIHTKGVWLSCPAGRKFLQLPA